MTKTEKAVVRAVKQCIDKHGFAFRLATEANARTYFINERAFFDLEKAYARHAAAMKGKKR